MAASSFVVVEIKEPQSWLNSNILVTWFFGVLWVTLL